MSETIKLFDEFFDHKFIHTGQNWDYSLNEIFFKDFNLRAPDYYLNCVGKKNLGESIGNVISKSYDIFKGDQSDAI